MVPRNKSLTAALAAILIIGNSSYAGQKYARLGAMVQPQRLSASSNSDRSSLEGVISRIDSYNLSAIDGKKASPGLIGDFVRSVIPSHLYSSNVSFRLLSDPAYDALVQPGVEGDFLKSYARTRCSVAGGKALSFETVIRAEDAKSALFYACVEIGHAVYRLHPARRRGPVEGFFEGGGDLPREELFCWLLAEALRRGRHDLPAPCPMSGAVELAISRAGSLGSAAKILYEDDSESCARITESDLYLKFKDARSKGLAIPPEFEGKTVPEALLVDFIQRIGPDERQALVRGDDLQASVRSVVGRVTKSAIPVERIRVGRVEKAYWNGFLRMKGFLDYGGYSSRESFDGESMYLDVVVMGGSGDDLRLALGAIGRRLCPSTQEGVRSIAGGMFLEACGYK